ncbi:hypothetical protein AX774_g7428, partial [Zancudomyces culisetae]
MLLGPKHMFEWAVLDKPYT